MKDRVCWECKGKMKEVRGEYEPGVEYRHWKCQKCGDEVLDMEQLEELALKHKKWRRAQATKVSKWGSALAIRIPKEIVIEQKIKVGEKFRFLKEKTGFKLIPEKD